jgi:hypothetical protein
VAESRPGGSTADPIERRWRRALRWLGARPFSQLATGLLLAGLIISAPFGGWREAKPATVVTQAKAGETLDVGPMVLTLTDAYWTTRPAETFAAHKSGVYLLVNGTARTNDKTTLGLETIAGTVRLRGVAGLQRDIYLDGPAVPEDKAVPTLFHREDAESLGAIGPGMTYRVAWAFSKQGSGTDLPDHVDVFVYRHTWRKSSITRVEEWLDRADAYTVRVPLTAKPAWTKPAEQS